MSRKRRRFSKEFKAKVALEALRERETLQELARRYELHPNQIITWKKHLKEEMATLFARKNEQKGPDLERENARLYEEIGRLKMERDWLKKSLISFSRRERLGMVDRGDPALSVRRQCQLLSLNRSLVYYRPAGESTLNLELMRVIDELHLLDPSLGSPRIRELLCRMDYPVSLNRIERLMRKVGIRASYPVPKTSTKSIDHQVFPYLLRGLKIVRPDQVWCADITYIPVEGGFFYLVAIMDWFSRYVLSWELSNSMETSFCLEALNSAMANRVPGIFNTDQGSQFTSNSFVNALQGRHIQVSHDGKGRFIDNIFIERLWRSLKYEEVYAYCYQDGHQANQRIENWINRYNQIRPHQSLDYHTPDEIYFGKPKKKLSLSEFRMFFL